MAYVNLNLAKIKLYHISSIVNRESILKNGLLPKGKTTGLITYEPCIFLSEKKNDIAIMDFINQWDNIDIWEVFVNKKDLQKDKFSHLPYHHYINKKIPIKQIKLS